MVDTAVSPQVASLATTPPGVSVNARTRTFGLFVLLAASFVPSLLNSTLDFLGPHPYGPASALGYVRVLLKQLTCLALLVYVLRRKGQTLGDIGLRIGPNDLAHAGLLIIASWFAYQIPRGFAIYIYRLAGHEPKPYLSSLAGAGLAIPIIFALVNPFFEELIVRAFLISEVMFLTGSAALAVAVSTILQTSYHLYQGIPNAIGHGFVFLMFSVYYVRKRRAWPLILAHLYADIQPVIYYALHHR